MDVEIEIEDHFYIGSNEPKDAVLILKSQNDKRKMFQNADKLGDIVNENGRKYILRDYKIQKTTELSQKMQGIIEDMNQNVDDVDQEEVFIETGAIHVGDGVYQKQVVPPDPTKVLQLPMEKLDQIMTMKL